MGILEKVKGLKKPHWLIEEEIENLLKENKISKEQSELLKKSTERLSHSVFPEHIVSGKGVVEELWAAQKEGFSISKETLENPNMKNVKKELEELMGTAPAEVIGGILGLIKESAEAGWNKLQGKEVKNKLKILNNAIGIVALGATSVAESVEKNIEHNLEEEILEELQIMEEEKKYAQSSNPSNTIKDYLQKGQTEKSYARYLIEDVGIKDPEFGKVIGDLKKKEFYKLLENIKDNYKIEILSQMNVEEVEEMLLMEIEEVKGKITMMDKVKTTIKDKMKGGNIIGGSKEYLQ